MTDRPPCSTCPVPGHTDAPLSGRVPVAPAGEAEWITNGTPLHRPCARNGADPGGGGDPGRPDQRRTGPYENRKPTAATVDIDLPPRYIFCRSHRDTRLDHRIRRWRAGRLDGVHVLQDTGAGSTGLSLAQGGPQQEKYAVGLDRRTVVRRREPVGPQSKVMHEVRSERSRCHQDRPGEERFRSGTAGP